MSDLFSLPASWVWARFDEVARIAPSLVSPDQFPDAPHIAPNHIETQTGHLLPFKTIAEDEVKSPKHLFHAGQIVYSKIRPYPAKVIIADFDGLCSADMYPIDSYINVQYLRWWMLTPAFTAAAALHQGRSVLPKINSRALNTLPVPVPPLNEQRRIVDALENHLYGMDSALFSLSKARDRTAFLRAEILRRATQVSTDESDLSAHWKSVRVGDLATVGTGSTPPRSKKDYYENGTIPWVTSSLVNRPIIDSTEQRITEKALAETSVRTWPPGTLLIAMYGEGQTRGRCSELRITAATNQACAAIQLLPGYEEVRPWLKLVLRASYEQNRKLASGGVQPNLNLSIVRSIPVPLPPLGEQTTILAKVTQHEEVAERLRSSIVQNMARAAILRLFASWCGWVRSQVGLR